MSVRDTKGDGMPARRRTYEEFRADVIERATVLAGCNETCTGTTRVLGDGHMPRCLFVDRGDGDFTRGAVAIGEAPAGVRDDESEFILSRVLDDRRILPTDQVRRSARVGEYIRWVEAEVLAREPYYVMMRAALTAFGHTGPVLWTDVVKCDIDKALPEDSRFAFGGARSRAVKERCAMTHLRQELALVDPSWPIFGSTGAARFVDRHRDLLGVASDRRVVALPHPSARTLDLLSNFEVTLRPNAACEAKLGSGEPFVPLSAARRK